MLGPHLYVSHALDGYRGLTLEQLSQRLDEFQLHVFQQSSDVVVGLDSRTWSLETDTFDDIWVKGSLQQPLDLSFRITALLLDLFLSSSLNLGSFSLEDLDKGVSDDFSLSLWVLDSLQLVQEKVGSIDNGQVDSELSGKHFVNLFALVLSQNTIVNHDGVESGVRNNVTRQYAQLTYLR